MDSQQIKVYLAFVDIALRNEVSEIFEALGYRVVLCEKSEVLNCPDAPNSLTVIETGDDGALISRLVYELYMTHGTAHTLPIIGIISAESLTLNHSLTWWLVEGHAAIIALLMRSDELLRDLQSYGARIKKTTDSRYNVI